MVASEEQHSSETNDPVLERANQTRSSRLCEYVTGMRPENPKLIERLEEDKKIIRAKYHLPSPDLPPAEFERSLKQIAKKMGIKVRSKHEYSKQFEETPDAGAMSLDGGKIVVGIDNSSIEKYRKSLKQMEHELVHGIQEKQTPSMPIELMEYEAYISNINLESLKVDPEDVDEILFKVLIGGSVHIYYDLESKRRGERLSPVWEDPKYFLEKDAKNKSEKAEQRKKEDFKQIKDIRSQLGITETVSGN